MTHDVASLLDWQTVAMALGCVVAALAAIIWGRVSGELARVSENLVEVARIVHGHGIRLDYLEGGNNAE